MLKKIFTAIIVTGVATLALFAFLNEFTETSIAVAFSLLLLLVLGYVFSKTIISPISKITTEDPSISEDYTEISELIHKIKRQNILIERQMKDLRKKQEEFKTITDNMSEGLVLVDKKAEIIFLNKSASRLSKGFFDLGRTAEFNKVVSIALKGKQNRHTYIVGSKVYEIYANPVITEEKISGVIILILDITEKEKREEMRREFSSNVSHELKTPLTAIMGISELMMNGMIRQEDEKAFAKNIYDESTRLFALVNDIIKISRLDEENEDKQFEEVDLFLEAKSVKERLESIAAKTKVEISLEGETTVVLGDRVIINEIIYNLVDNAIKYNKENGQVNIKVDKEKTITVADTGIGIAAENLDRIFERFYRVDKSRSSLTGGTGLGLSIVKHGAEYLGATIKVTSTEGKGTEISVEFK